MKPSRTPERYPSGLHRARFPDACARARRERYRFDDVCVSPPQTLGFLRPHSLIANALRRRWQRASGPPRLPCAEQHAIVLQLPAAPHTEDAEDQKRVDLGGRRIITSED